MIQGNLLHDRDRVMAENGGANAGAEMQAVRVKTTQVAVPEFSEEQFKTYMEEVMLWREVCDVPKAKQGIML